MFEYRKLSERLNRNFLQKLRDSLVRSISRKPEIKDKHISDGDKDNKEPEKDPENKS
jgi:hypothetical protein